MIRANHIGDWGTQFGMLIAYLEKVQNEQASELELSDLEAFYREAKNITTKMKYLRKRARGYVVKLQGGDEYLSHHVEKTGGYHHGPKPAHL